MSNIKRKVIAVVGPTASGKTGIGVKLAKEFNGEIVSADSRQVFRGLNIGTGKDLIEYDGVKYHMIDVADHEIKMTLFDYLPLARAAIEDIFSRGKLPIIVGGTGLYVQGIVEGFELEKLETCTAPNPSLERGGSLDRERLNNLTITQLNNLLAELDPEKAETIDKKNTHRLIRAIELAQSGEKPIKIKPDFEVLQMAVDLPRAKLHENIDKRVDERFQEGMLEEVVGLLNKGVNSEWLIGLGLEYRVITEYLLDCHFGSMKSVEKSFEKNCPSEDLSTPLRSTLDDKKFEDMKQQLKYRIHQFARRQITWFKRFPEVNWLSNYEEFKRFTKIFLEH